MVYYFKADFYSFLFGKALVMLLFLRKRLYVNEFNLDVFVLINASAQLKQINARDENSVVLWF